MQFRSRDMNRIQRPQRDLRMALVNDRARALNDMAIQRQQRKFVVTHFVLKQPPAGQTRLTVKSAPPVLW